METGTVSVQILMELNVFCIQVNSALCPGSCYVNKLTFLKDYQTDKQLKQHGVFSMSHHVEKKKVKTYQKEIYLLANDIK